jgi:hypothetical protein
MNDSILTTLKTIDFSKYIQQLASGFQSRSWVFNRIDHWLQQKDQRFFVLAREPGVGEV